MSNYFTEKEFKGLTVQALEKGEYENCVFINCNLANSDLSTISFLECEFESCDLSMARLTNTSFRDVTFKTCKLLGLHFENCERLLFSAEFENCQLNLCSFYKMNLKNAKFKTCNLREADFTETDLTGSDLTACDFSGATFEFTSLEKADLRMSYNFSIDPEKNRIKKAKFSLQGITGLLDKYDIEVE